MMTDHGQVKRFYDEHYYSEECEHGLLPWHMRRVASRLGSLAGVKVLDIACGTGAWLSELANRGADVAGIDISERAIEQARHRLPEAEIHLGVAERLPFPDSRFDLVTCMGSLEHFLDQPKALKEMLRVAKSNARFLILVPNAGFLTRRIGLYGGTGQTAIRETVRPIEEWERMFREAGLEVARKWRDLHPISSHWIRRGSVIRWPVRAAQACALALWPMKWQYQVYFLCQPRRS